MQRKSKIFTACMLFLPIILTGCSSTTTMKLPYVESVEVKMDIPVSTNNISKAEFISSDLCVVPLGEDVGDDTEMTGISSLLFDITNNNVIYSDNIYQRIYPASLTKVLTALLVLEECDLTEVVTISYNASHIQELGAKLCGFKEGDKIVLGDLLTALLIYSGNDAGIAIAEHVSGTEEAFCKKMNEKAHSIGAVDTHFTNSHGLHDENHYTTAYDLYLIFSELLSYEKAKEMITMPSITVKYTDAENNEKESLFYNTNKYIKGDIAAPEGLTVEGGKTGTTNAAGYCLELLVTDEQGIEYIAMVLKAGGTDNLYGQMNHLISKIQNE